MSTSAETAQKNTGPACAPTPAKSTASPATRTSTPAGAESVQSSYAKSANATAATQRTCCSSSRRLSRGPGQPSRRQGRQRGQGGQSVPCTTTAIANPAILSKTEHTSPRQSLAGTTPPPSCGNRSSGEYIVSSKPTHSRRRPTGKPAKHRSSLPPTPP